MLETDEDVSIPAEHSTSKLHSSVSQVLDSSGQIFVADTSKLNSNESLVKRFLSKEILIEDTPLMHTLSSSKLTSGRVTKVKGNAFKKGKQGPTKGSSSSNSKTIKVPPPTINP